MTQANFYELYTVPIKIAFSKLIESILAKNNTVQVVCANDDEVKFYDSLLWTYSQLSFIPHSSYKDGFCDDQSVYITLKIDDNPLASKITFMFDFELEILNTDILSSRERIIWIYESGPSIVAKVTKLKKRLHAAGIKIMSIQERNGVWKTVEENHA